MCHFRVAADDRGADLGPGRSYLLKDAIDQLRGCVLRQQYRREEPAWNGARRRHIVGIDVHGIPANLVCGKGNRIGFGYKQILAAEVQYRAVETDTGA